MSYKIEKEEKNSLKIQINIDKEKLLEEIKKIYNENKKVFKVPGFRNGKIPFEIVTKFYGIEIFYEEATKRLLNDEIIEFISKESANYSIAEDVEPEINVDEVSLEKGIKASLEFALLPEVKVSKYNGLKSGVTKERITAKKINEKVEEEAKKNARLVESDEEAKNGDILTIDFEGFTLEDNKETPFEGGKAEKFDIKLGSNTFIPGFEDQLVGLKKNDSKDVLVKFPENYGSEFIAGKDAKFKVFVHEVKKEELPKIDDEFAKDLGYENLDEYKAEVKKNLEKEAVNKYNAELKNDLLNQLIKNTKIELADKIIESKLNRYIEGMNQQYMQLGITLEQMLAYTSKTIEDFKKESRENIKNQILSELILKEIAKNEKLVPSDKDIEDALKEYAKKYKDETSVEELKKHQQLVQTISNNLKSNMALDLVVKNISSATKETTKETSKEK